MDTNKDGVRWIHLEEPIRHLGYGCDVLFHIAESISQEERDADANALYFVARAMEREIQTLRDLLDRATKKARRAGANGDASASGPAPKGPKGGPKLLLINGNGAPNGGQS